MRTLGRASTVRVGNEAASARCHILTGVRDGNEEKEHTSETDLSFEQEDQRSEPSDSTVVRTTLLLDEDILDDGSLGDSGAVEALQQGEKEPGQLFSLWLRSTNLGRTLPCQTPVSRTLSSSRRSRADFSTSSAEV